MSTARERIGIVVRQWYGDGANQCGRRRDTEQRHIVRLDDQQERPLRRVRAEPPLGVDGGRGLEGVGARSARRHDAVGESAQHRDRDLLRGLARHLSQPTSYGSLG